MPHFQVGLVQSSRKEKNTLLRPGAGAVVTASALIPGGCFRNPTISLVFCTSGFFVVVVVILFRFVLFPDCADN